MTRYWLVSCEPLDSLDRLLIVRQAKRPGWFARLLGASPSEETLRFVGTGTAWYQLPSFRSVDDSMIDMLRRMELRHRHRELLGQKLGEAI